MTRILILGIVLTLLPGCDFFKKKTPETAPVSDTKNEAPEPTAPGEPVNNDCENAEFANPSSLAKWKMKNGIELVVCELGSSFKISQSTISGWINIYKSNGGHLTPYIAEVNTERESDIDSYKIEKLNDEEVRITLSIRPISSEEDNPDLAVTEKTIDCKGKDCVAGSEKCMDLKKSGSIDEDAVKSVEKVAAGKAHASDYPMYDVVIGKVIDAAIAGDPGAKKLMLKTPKEKLGIDAASAEAYSDGRKLLDRLNGLHCL
jgi:hypothetical protein